MKIYCDYCGTQIETSIHKNCPNCGGSYGTDEELLRERERVKKLNELDMEKKELDLERMRIENQNLAAGAPAQKMSAAKGCLIAVITLLVIFGALFVMILAFVIADSSSGTKENERKEKETHTSISYTINMDDISMPEIPEIPEIKVPDMSDITIPEMTKIEIPEINITEQ